MPLDDEIAEQPRVIARLLDEGAGPARRIGRRFAPAEHISIAARGSSDNAATYGKYLFETIAGTVSALAAPSVVTRYGAAPDFRSGAVLGISQSGAAPDVAAVLAAARAAGAPTAAVTNAERSRVARSADMVFPLRAGPERSVAATKTYTATCLALALLASECARARGREALSFDGLAVSVADAVALGPQAAATARALGRATRLIVLARGYAYAAALEAALKIKELARIWAEPYSTADFAHGPIALLERGAPVLLFAARGATARETRTLSRALRSRGARLFAVTDDPGLAETTDGGVLLRARVAEALAPIPFAVVAQQLAVALARRRGLDPDRPAGLTKVTRTR